MSGGKECVCCAVGGETGRGANGTGETAGDVVAEVAFPDDFGRVSKGRGGGRDVPLRMLPRAVFLKKEWWDTCMSDVTSVTWIGNEGDWQRRAENPGRVPGWACAESAGIDRGAACETVSDPYYNVQLLLLRLPMSFLAFDRNFSPDLFQMPPPALPKLGQTRCCEHHLLHSLFYADHPRLDTPLCRPRVPLRRPRSTCSSRSPGGRHRRSSAPRVCPPGRARQRTAGPAQGPPEPNFARFRHPCSLLPSRPRSGPFRLLRRASRLPRRGQGLF